MIEYLSWCVMGGVVLGLLLFGYRRRLRKEELAPGHSDGIHADDRFHISKEVPCYTSAYDELPGLTDALETFDEWNMNDVAEACDADVDPNQALKIKSSIWP